MIVIQSRDNPLVKRVHALSTSGRERRKQGLTVLDGAHLVAAALDAGVGVCQLVVSESGLASEEHQALIARLDRLCPQATLPDKLFAHVSGLDTPSGLLALMATPALGAPVATVAQSVVVLDGVQDAGNLGTLLRTAAAAGIQHAWLTEGCAQAWSPRVLRAGMGAHFLMKVYERVDAVSLLADFPGPVMATVLGARSQSLYAVDLAAPTAWLFGAEGRGLSPALLARATCHVHIPMPGAIESLNVAAAAAICLFEQVRQQG
ncbi:TrmH family RNA methyltransferase [Denitromonas iodatirespirans]|uniref:RNA methyltransferase n=1 Tax=Denitromonas iodatirespirans TaxID=2795389 RepID=A0A944H6H0_DENI1|nr:RNA methyltransferase [Denitromonas iodatirespirans]MBT0960174.1 RNA methyltransferase [Denitromonas iodatirespirans]